MEKDNTNNRENTKLIEQTDVPFGTPAESNTNTTRTVIEAENVPWSADEQVEKSSTDTDGIIEIVPGFEKTAEELSEANKDVARHAVKVVIENPGPQAIRMNYDPLGAQTYGIPQAQNTKRQ